MARRKAPVSAERTRSAEETEALGERIVEELSRGDIVLVGGELGAGKTTLIRGACRALGVVEPVTSPTFTIGQRYAGRVPVSHVDLYRIDEFGREEPGFLDDYLTADAISFIEWPAVAEPDVENVALRIEIRHAGGDNRVIEISS